MILKDCCKFQEGYVNPTQKKMEYFDGKIKWLRSMDLNNGYIYDTSRTLTEEGFKSAGKSAYLFPKDSIAISKSGTIGQLGIIKNEMCGNRAVINIVVNNKMADLYYIFYLLQFKKIEIINKAVGSIQKNLYISALEKVSINHSDLTEQENIGKTIRIIDDKIDLNNKCISKLEQMMKDIYDYWLVQFDFPNEKGKPYKSSGGKMVYNEKLKREIPEIFKIEKLCNITNIYQPKTISEKDLDKNGQYFVYGANGIIGKYNKYNHECNEIAICCRGASCGNLLMTLPFSWITGNSMIVSPIEDSNVKEYIYYYLLKHGLKKYVTGSAQPQITRANIEKMDIVLPHNDLLNNFNDISLETRKKTIKLILENNILKEYRNFILPLLMNGQVEVK